MSPPSATTDRRADNGLTSASGAARSVQAQPAELPTPSLQALKQRAHQLLESQRSLQHQNQALSAERDALQAERDSLTAHLQELTAQRDSIQQQWETLHTRVEDLQGQLREQSEQMADQDLHFETLLSQCEALQAQIDAHQQSTHALKRQNKDLSCKYDLLKKDLNKISGQKRELQDSLSSATGHSAMLKAAYLHVFPYSHYRSIRPDLDSMDDIEIADHFFMYGLSEGCSIQDFMR